VGQGGAGTNLGALAAGIPLVLIPQGADQGGQAECVARTGAAITIAAEAFSPRAVALAVADVLEQPSSYRATARRIAHRIATTPSADDVAALLARAAHPGSDCFAAMTIRELLDRFSPDRGQRISATPLRWCSRCR
jgi:UDP:flavonoid glycosyltransferase YjiC (YdhE family)